VFACNMKAMTPAQRKRHFEILLPALQSARLSASELPDGYALQFPSDAKTFATMSEWIGNERLCCPFFAFDLHVGDNSAPMVLRITGPEGVKQFIQAELSDLLSNYDVNAAAASVKVYAIKPKAGADETTPAPCCGPNCCS
jgi:hypothetical protein